MTSSTTASSCLFGQRLSRVALSRAFIILAVGLCVIFALAAAVGNALGSGVLHPARLNSIPTAYIDEMFRRAGATREDFIVTAPDRAALHGWKARPMAANGDWIILFHGVSDTRNGNAGAAELLLRHGYSVVMMDSRAHGESGGAMATYGWKERYDAVAVVNALNAQERVRHLGALGVSMGAAIALQSAAVEPRIEAVVAEDSFADLREVSYDYAGLHWSPLLGKTLFRPATIFGMRSMAAAGGFPPDDVSPVKAVHVRTFPVLLVCGTRDVVIPCRHSEAIYESALGPKELWVVRGARHASALGTAPAEYESHVIGFLDRSFSEGNTAARGTPKPF